MIEYLKAIDLRQVFAALVGAVIQSTGFPAGIADAIKALYGWIVS
jgi:hypothetical protein